MPRTALVNNWYAHPVGHAIEGLRYALGYHLADPELQISVLLNGATAWELADLCPFVARVYPVPYTSFVDVVGDPAAALADVPRVWDYVVDEHRAHIPQQLESYPGLRAYYEAAWAHFEPRRAHGVAGAEPPSYRRHGRLRLELPEGARQRAGAALGGGATRIALMPAGSSDEPWAYPSTGSWALVVTALAEALPGAHFCLVGKLKRDGRTFSRATRGDVDAIAGACPAAFDAFDLPLIDQLALVEACDVFVSPHSGFGMAALAVGTPWLTLAGGRWPEFFFNGVPFHSVLPDPDRYPCYTWWEPLPVIENDAGEGPRTPSMSRARIVEDLPELVEAARDLVADRVDYQQALRSHFPRVLAIYGGDRTKLFSLDRVHEGYV